MFALVFITDAPEQSWIKSDEFLAEMLGKKGKLELIKGYGVFGSKDFGCKPTDDEWNYTGSEFERFVLATKGKTYKLCDPDFGPSLLEIAKDIVTSSEFNKTIFLPSIPVAGSITVRYKGALLPEGPLPGGYWIYDSLQNAIVFHNLDFATGPLETVEINYQT
jgi:hypothetical protein